MLSKITEKENQILELIKQQGKCDADELVRATGLVKPYLQHRIKILKLKGYLDEQGNIVANVSPSVVQANPTVTTNIVEEGDQAMNTVVETVACNIDVNTLIPEKDSNYHYRNGIDDIIKRFASRNLPLFLIGEAGSGKTHAIKQYAADCGLPFLRVACDDSAILKEFIGKREIIHGTTFFKMGLLTQLIQVPSVVLFDEFNALPASKLFFLHELLDTRKLLVKDAGSGMLIDVNPNCKIFLACNPNSARYIGTNKINVALADRGGYINVPNFKPEEVQGLFDCGKTELTDCLVKFYQQVHRAITEQSLKLAFSLRSIMRISSALKAGDTVEDALEYGFYNCALLTATQKERDSMKEIARVIFGPDKFTKR